MKRSELGPGALSRERGSTFKQRKPLKRTRGYGGPTTPHDVWLLVLARDQGRCVWCRYEGRDEPAKHPHHLLPKSGWPEFVGTVANIVGLTGARHMTHEFSPRARLPWAALPESCQGFLMAIAAVDARAAHLIAVKYPGSGM